MAIREIGASITLQNDQFKKEMAAVNSNLAGLRAEIKNVTAEMDLNGTTVDALARKQKLLDDQEAQARQKVADLTKAFEAMAAQEGENSVAADKLRTQLNNATAEMLKAQKAAKDNAAALEDAQKVTKEYTPVNEKAAKAIKELRERLADKVEEVKKAAKNVPGLSEAISVLGATGSAAKKGLELGASGIKATAAASAAAVAAVAAFGAALLKAVNDVATLGDEIDKNSQKMGLSAEAYQEWDFILQHSGSSIDKMKESMPTLSKAAVDGSEAFKKLGLAQEDVAAMSPEELFAATISGLQQVEDETQRTVLAQQLLGGGAKELGALLNTSAEDTEALRQRVHDLGGVMSEDAVKAAASYKDSLQDLKTAFSGLKRGALQDLMPAVTLIMDGITDMFAGEDGAEKISEGLRQLLSNAFEGAAENLDDVLELAQEILSVLIEGLREHAPELAAGATQIITTLLNFLIEHAPELLTAGIDLLEGVISGLVEALPELVPAAVQLIQQLVMALATNAPDLVVSGLQLILALVQGLIAAIPDLIKSIPEIIDALVEGFKEAWPEIKQIGLDIINSVWEGMKEAFAPVIDWFKGAVAKLTGKASVDIDTSGSHAGGLPYVPFDGYVAELHKGERVLTAAEAQAYDRGGPGRSVSVNIYPKDLSRSIIDYIIRQVNEELGGDVA